MSDWAWRHRRVAQRAAEQRRLLDAGGVRLDRARARIAASGGLLDAAERRLVRAAAVRRVPVRGHRDGR